MLKILKQAFLIIGIFNTLQAQISDWNMKIVPDSIMPKTAKIFLKTIIYNAKDLTDYLPDDYVKDGSVDYTSELQKGIDENIAVIFPDFSIRINDAGLHLKSNSKIFFNKNSKLILSSSNKGTYCMLCIENVENINLFNVSLIGDKSNHLDDKGQWGMGIRILNSKNIKIYSPQIEECWGDGIYIGNKSKTFSEHVLIRNAYLNNNRRNGMSITSGRKIKIKNSTFSNSNGQNPQSGIDIEPNSNSDIIEKVKLKDITTFNNLKMGVIISTGNLAGPIKKNVSINIKNHTDLYSNFALGIAFTRRENIKNYGPENISGNLNLRHLKYIDNEVFIFNNTNLESKIKVKISDFQFTKNFEKKIIDRKSIHLFLNSTNLDIKKI